MMRDAPDLVVGYAPGYRASWQTALGGVPAPLVVPNDRKWSGDHCIEPSKVPGILFTSFTPTQPVASIAELPTLIRGTLGLTGRIDAARTAGSLGYLDLAAPVLGGIDRTVAGFLPAAARVALWALLAAGLALAVYRLVARRQGRARAFVAMLLAAVPVVLILAFLARAFDAREPAAGERVTVTLEPAIGRVLPPVSWRGDGSVVETAPGRFEVTWPAAGHTLTLHDSDGARLLTLPTAAPVRTVSQWAWWNRLHGNPGGYLPAPGEVAAVRLDLPQPSVLPFGPDWLRGWLPLTLLLLLVFSLLLKFYPRSK
jgi:hypothetical protein